jgi:hypothetical protein
VLSGYYRQNELEGRALIEILRRPNPVAVILDDRASLGDSHHANAMRLRSKRQSAIMSRHR